MRRAPSIVVVVSLVLGIACEAQPGSDSGIDAGADGSVACGSDRDCDDSLFCNGTERCEPDSPGADASGCARGSSPCGAGTRCDEGADACRLCEGGDLDGDGVDGTACGGNDCDDDDPARYPGALEICDALDQDEDCDPTTFGERDVDGDLELDAACCNHIASGAAICGTDCDDSAAGVSSRATETCNRIDDDCDGATDEGVLVALYHDADLDGFATRDESATPMLACAASEGWVIARGDCDDGAAGVNPGVPEVCNAVDDDCDGLSDDVTPGVVACIAGSSRPCVTGCGVAGTAACRADCLGLEACVGAEVCNGCDDDADGARDEDFACERGFPIGCTTACGTTGTRQCSASCELSACVAAESCNYCDDDGLNGFIDERVLAADSELDRGLRYGGTAFGTAHEDAVPPTGGGSFLVYADLIDGAAVSQTGTYWFDLDEYLGWGAMRIDARLEVQNLDGGTPMGGWSIVVARGGTGDLGTPADYGVPTTLEGVRFDWHWGSLEARYGYPIQPDMLGYRRMTGAFFIPRGNTGGRPDARVDVAPSGDLDAATTGIVTQRMTIDYQPENPYTTAREERVVLTGNGGSVTYAPDMIGDTQDPSNDLPIGSHLRIGITAGSFPFTYRLPDGTGPFTVGARIRARLLLTIIMPPSGPGDVTYFDYVTLSRSLICPTL